MREQRPEGRNPRAQSAAFVNADRHSPLRGSSPARRNPQTPNRLILRRQNAQSRAEHDPIPRIQMDPLPIRRGLPGRGHFRQERLHGRPFLIGQVARIALRLLGDLAHPATALGCPPPSVNHANRNLSKSLSTWPLSLPVADGPAPESIPTGSPGFCRTYPPGAPGGAGRYRRGAAGRRRCRGKQPAIPSKDVYFPNATL